MRKNRYDLSNLDNAFENSNIEDKVWLFWKNNKTLLIGLSVVIIILFVVIQGLNLYQKQTIKSIQGAYNQITNERERVNFGKAYSTDPLGGLALLQAADSEYEKGKYSSAAQNYKAATIALSGLPFQSRASLGAGISLIRGGQMDRGKAILKRLANDAKTLDVIRAEAAYNIALIALVNRHYLEAKNWLSIIEKLNFKATWATQAHRLKSEI